MTARLAAVLLLAATLAGAQPVKTASVKGGFSVNGIPTQSLGLGTYKQVLLHPQDPELVVKLFVSPFAESLPEKRREVRDIRALEPHGAAPKMTEQGAIAIDGKPVGFVVQERVRGYDLKNPTPTKIQETAKLFAKLKNAKVTLADGANLHKLRENIMVGETRSGGFGAYLVDADLQSTTKTKAELDAYYDGLLSALARR